MSEQPPQAISEAEELQSAQRIERGGLPVEAERRLRALGAGAGAFTSDLSVGDFALCRTLGLRPLAQVMGSSIYQVGYPWAGGFMGGGAFFELTTVSHAWNDARSRALGRLAQEAQLLGADAVAGVEVRSGGYDWAEGAIEVAFLGTAVRREGAAPAAPAGAPVLTELSVADFAKLARAGIEPLGIVAWTTVFVAQSLFTGGLLGGVGYSNQELPEVTEALYSARETAVGRLTRQALERGASGVIGVRIDHSITPLSLGGQRQSALMLSFHVIGTAIREPRGASFQAPQTVLDLTN